MADLSVEGVVADVAAVGADGGNGDPVGLTGEELFGIDMVVADRAVLAEQIDIEGVGAADVEGGGEFCRIGAAGELYDRDGVGVVLVFEVLPPVGVGPLPRRSHPLHEGAHRIHGMAARREPDASGDLLLDVPAILPILRPDVVPVIDFGIEDLPDGVLLQLPLDPLKLRIPVQHKAARLSSRPMLRRRFQHRAERGRIVSDRLLDQQMLCPYLRRQYRLLAGCTVRGRADRDGIYLGIRQA